MIKLFDVNNRGNKNIFTVNEVEDEKRVRFPRFAHISDERYLAKVIY